MPKVIKELSAKTVEKLAKQEGRHNVGGCSGLYLRVTETGFASWVLRIKLPGRRADVGLGSLADVSLEDAREEGRRLRREFKNSSDADPVATRKQAKVQAKAAAEELHKAAELGRITFETDARELHAIKSKEFKNAKHAAQWINSLSEYAKAIWHKPVRDINRDDVLAVLQPIWESKTETATRVRQRIEQVLAYAAVNEHRPRDAENPARWEGGLQMLLPKPTKLKKTQHHPALPWKRMPAFMASLRAREGMRAKGLEFAILTAARSGEVRFATWGEVDLDAALWTVPADRMKARLEHKVPLVPAAVTLLRGLKQAAPEDLIFPNTKGTPLSDATLASVCDAMHEAATKAGEEGWLDPKQKKVCTPHGMRSAFKTWCQEAMGARYLDEVSELALAHVNDDKTRSAYARGELIELRTELMGEWASYLAG